MKLALLCVTPEVLATAQAACAAGHQIVAVYDADEYSEQLRKLAPVALYDDQWESLLDHSLADVVVVGMDSARSESLIERLRKLAQAAVPFAPVFPVCESIVGFEIEMIQQDTGVPIAPFFFDLSHPAFATLSETFRDPENALGALEQLVVERQLLDADREEVLGRLARDVQIARQLVGELNRVSGMGDAGKTSNLGNLSVHMSGSEGVLVRWSTTPASQEASGKMTFIGAKGRATLDMRGDGWRLALPGREPLEFSDWSPDEQTLATLDAAVSRQPTSPTWSDVCRSSEIAETAERSVRKGKTIELYHEPHTEESTFKGMMAAGGCLLLMLTFGVMLSWSLIEGIRYPNARAKFQVQRDARQQKNPGVLDELPVEQKPQWPLYLRVWPVYPFAIFLALQFLRLVFRAPDNAPSAVRTSDLDGD